MAERRPQDTSHRPHQGEPPPPQRFQATTTAVACTLTTKEASTQLDSWDQLRRHALSSTALENGAEMTFPRSKADALQRLATREASCCSFLTIEITTSDDTVSVAITTDAEGGQAIIHRIAGVPPSEHITQ